MRTRHPQSCPKWAQARRRCPVHLLALNLLGPPRAWFVNCFTPPELLSQDGRGAQQCDLHAGEGAGGASGSGWTRLVAEAKLHKSIGSLGRRVGWCVFALIRWQWKVIAVLTERRSIPACRRVEGSFRSDVLR